MTDTSNKETTAMTIVDSLRPLAVPIDNVETDPENARRGDVGAVRRSLNVFGQRKPLVVKRTGHDAAGRPTGIVIAGNHTLMAARELEWPEVAAVFVEDDSMTARAFALTDNRTGELATWNYEQLADTLHSLSEEEFDMSVLGWSPQDLEALLNASFTPDEPAGDLESDHANGDGHILRLTGEQWRHVRPAIQTVKDDKDTEISDEDALVVVCQQFLATRS